MIRLARVLLLAIAGLAAAAPASPAGAGSLPGGVADAAGRLGLIEGVKGVQLIDLASGRARWTSQAGRLPLTFVGARVAVLADDPAHRNRATVVFLDLATGKLVGTSPALTFPDWASTSLQGGKGFRASAQVIAGELVVEWHASSSWWGGVAPPPTYRPSLASGRFRVSDKAVTALGKVSNTDEVDGAAPALPASLAGHHFSNVFDSRVWSDLPRASGGGFVAVELAQGTRADRQALRLLRWDAAGKPQPTVALLEGRSLMPTIDPVAGTLVVFQGIPLADQPQRERVVSVFSLVTGARLAEAPYDQTTYDWHWVAPRLFGVLEGPQLTAADAGRSSALTLVAFDAAGKRLWAHALAPRRMLLPPP
jgi:hypothetical protein